MNIIIDRFASGWVGLSLELCPDEIDNLISRLSSLKVGRCGHFHIRCNDMNDEPGVADMGL